MISYEQFQRIHHFRRQGLTASQIAAESGLNVKTVTYWMATNAYHQRKRRKPSEHKLEPYKETVKRLVNQHPFTGVQIMSKLREQGYTGGYTILKDHLRLVRPVEKRAFLTAWFKNVPFWVTEGSI
jgi:transposase